MAADEIIRTLAYIVIIPLAGYVGVRVWNALIMPIDLRRHVAIFLWLQSAIYTMLMVGLLLLRLWHSVPILLWLNTVFIVSQAVVLIVVVVQANRVRAARLLQALILLTTILILRGSE